MAVTIDGTTGVSGVDGGAATPAYRGGDADTGLFYPSAGVVALTTNGSERLRIDSSGNVGIGTANPGAPLDVYSATNARINAYGDSTTALVLGRYSTDANGATLQLRKGRGTVASPSVVSNGDNAGLLAFQALAGTNNRNVALISSYVDTIVSDTNISGYLSFATNGGSTTATERMRIDSSGNVGIGTASPAVDLHVSSVTGSASPTPTEVRIATTTDASDWSTTLPWGRLSFYSGDASSTGPKIHASIDTICNTTTGGASSLVFSTNPSGTLTETFRFGPSGQLGIGGANYGTSGQVLTSGGSGAAPSWTSVGAVTITTYSSGSGTWTKPSTGTFARVRMWGAGGSGGKSTSTTTTSGAFQSFGGGGGAYIEHTYRLSDLNATESYSIGAGGIAITSTSGGDGNPGGNTTFKTLTAYGGAAGAGAGRSGSNSAGGSFSGAVQALYPTTNAWDGGVGTSGTGDGGSTYYGGAGGGGGGTGTAGTASNGGTSVFGGAGGNGNTTSGGTAGSGTAPAGGGGGKSNNTGGSSGAGGAGRIEIWVW